MPFLLKSPRCPYAPSLSAFYPKSPRRRGRHRRGSLLTVQGRGPNHTQRDEPGLGWVRSETQPEQPSLYCTWAAKSQLFRFAGTPSSINTNQFVVPAVFSLPLPLSLFRSNATKAICVARSIEVPRGGSAGFGSVCSAVVAPLPSSYAKYDRFYRRRGGSRPIVPMNADFVSLTSETIQCAAAGNHGHRVETCLQFGSVPVVECEHGRARQARIHHHRKSSRKSNISNFANHHFLQPALTLKCADGGVVEQCQSQVNHLKRRANLLAYLTLSVTGVSIGLTRVATESRRATENCKCAFETDLPGSLFER